MKKKKIDNHVLLILHIAVSKHFGGALNFPPPLYTGRYLGLYLCKDHID